MKKVLLITIISVLLLSACGTKKDLGKTTDPNINQAASEINKETTVSEKNNTNISDGTVIENTSDGTIIETNNDGIGILTKSDGTKIGTTVDDLSKNTPAGEVIATPTEAQPEQKPAEAGVQVPADTAVQAPIEIPAQVQVEVPVDISRYELTSAETFLQQGNWSSKQMSTSDNVYEQLCVIGDGLTNGIYTEEQAIEKIKLIKDLTKPDWWIYRSNAKIVTASGKLDCSTMPQKQAIVDALNNNITLIGENLYTRVFYDPKTDTTIMYYVTVSGTTVHN